MLSETMRLCACADHPARFRSAAHIWLRTATNKPFASYAHGVRDGADVAATIRAEAQARRKAEAIARRRERVEVSVQECAARATVSRTSYEVVRGAPPSTTVSEIDVRRAGGATAHAAASRPAVAQGALERALAFRLTPREVKARLDAHVIAQEEAKRALSVAVCDHYNAVRRQLDEPTLSEERTKPNLLLLGPSGVGKTHLLRAVTKLLGVPFVTGDATKFSATGYVGGDVDELVRGLLPAAEHDAQLAELGIVCVDEV